MLLCFMAFPEKGSLGLEICKFLTSLVQRLWRLGAGAEAGDSDGVIRMREHSKVQIRLLET